MEYGENANALAFSASGAWVLKPICGGGGGFENGVAVRTPGGHVVVPAAPIETGLNAVAVAQAGGGRIVVPIGCPEGEESCSGTDPLCQYCDCTAGLRESYTVTVSGFPAICTVDQFNGVWTATWQSDCSWRCDIDEYRSITLANYSAGTWLVSWGIVTIGTVSGQYLGSGSPACRPTEYTWSYYVCNVPWGCFNLAANLQANGVVVVS